MLRYSFLAESASSASHFFTMSFSFVICINSNLSRWFRIFSKKSASYSMYILSTFEDRDSTVLFQWPVVGGGGVPLINGMIMIVR